MQTYSHPNPIVQTRPCTVKTTYESGMKISYDQTSTRVIVAFRGRITVLPEAYETEAKGIAAGEYLCRRLGWNPQEQGTPGKTLRTLF